MSRISPREETLFADALAQPPAEREAFLAKACGEDVDLLANLIALISAHEEADGLIAPVFIERSSASEEEAAGNYIGRYKLLEKLGEGGCGVVWMAEQEAPVRRRVALKVIKLGMDTREVIARFSAERQALALMNHPAIAKVFDAGSTSTGRPYFVMELVRGVRITKFCDDQHLDVAARLELFVHVCHAVQHAHQKGIIHRDLKPSNILVGFDESGPLPKVIDFGIAKATQGPLTDATLVTLAEQLIGTPAYMSPEQAEMNNLDIDTRTDVYSLGVVLYELLAGRLPFDPQSMANSPPEEFRRIIREIEPPKPSTRLSTLGIEERAQLAKQRGVATERFASTLSGDLDWIVMKALEKNRVRRYATPIALAEDIARHLENEPVVARPPGTLYRCRKFMRRNRLMVATVAAITMTLVVGSAVAIGQAVRAIRAERASTAARMRATDERARSEDLLIFMVEDLKEPLVRVGELPIVDRMIAKALERFSSRDPQDIDDRTRVNYVKILIQLGGLRADQARYAEAETAYRDAHTRALALVAHAPRNAAAWLARADAEWGNGFLQNKRGNVREAREWFLREHDSRAALIALEPENRQWQLDFARQQGNLAALLADSDPEEARASYRAQLETLLKFRPAKRDDVDVERSIANATGFLGLLAEAAGDFAEAAERFAHYTAQFAHISSLDPKDTHWLYKEVESLCLSAHLCLVTGQRADASRHIARARELVVPLVAQDGTNQRKQKALVVVDLWQAQLAQSEGLASPAAEIIRSKRSQLEAMAAKEPTDIWTRAKLALALRMEAEVQHTLAASDAGTIAARAIEVAEQLIRGREATAAGRAERAAAGVIAGRIAASQNNLEAARAHWQRAEGVLGPIDASVKDWRVLDPAARIARLLGQSARAATLISQLEQTGYVPIEPWPKPVITLPANKI